MNKKILKLAVPAILNNITVPLLGLSDTTIAGHLGSASFLAAMAIGAMMLNVIFWLCGFLRSGTTALVSQAFGARDLRAISLLLRKAGIIALVISAAVLLLQFPLERLLFLIIAPEESVSDLASLYFRICLWGVPAQLAIMIASGWFIGLQNTLIPMIIAIGVNVVNIILSVSLVFGFDCGFAGVAFGTLAANWLGAFAAVIFTVREWKKLSKSYSATTDSRPFNFNLWRVNTNLFFRSTCIMIVTLAMTSFGARIGETTLAANAVIMQYFLFFSYFMDGFAFAGEAIMGSAVGARNLEEQRRCVRHLMAWGAGMAALFFIIYLFGVPQITELLTDTDDVIATVGAMQPWVVALPPITVAAFLFDGIYIGLAKTGALLWTTLLAAAVFFAVTIIAGSSFVGLTNSILWTAFEAYLLIRGLSLSLLYFRRA